MKQLMIGGTALIKLGSSRHAEHVDYLINDKSTDDMFIHDKDNNIVYVNANGHNFYNEIWEMEKNNIGEIASPRALLEMKVFDFIQHYLNGFWQKVDDAEYDIRFLVRKYNLERVEIVDKYISDGQLSEVKKIINTTRK
jgi:hypothetical protein